MNKITATDIAHVAEEAAVFAGIARGRGRSAARGHGVGAMVVGKIWRGGIGDGREQRGGGGFSGLRSWTWVCSEREGMVTFRE